MSFYSDTPLVIRATDKKNILSLFLVNVYFLFNKNKNCLTQINTYLTTLSTYILKNNKENTILI